MRILFLFLSAFFALASTAQEKPEGLFINSKAPEFRAKDQSGNFIALKDLRKKGPVVVVFYRGFWCPYCNKELKNFQDSLNLITGAGATLVAISPEAPEGVNKTIEKTGAVFSILSDAEAKIAKAYNVAFDVDEKTANRYRSFGNDLLKINNEQKLKPVLPVPAVYIINRDGHVTYRFFDENYRRRPTVKELVEQLPSAL